MDESYFLGVSLTQYQVPTPQPSVSAVFLIPTPFLSDRRIPASVASCPPGGSAQRLPPAEGDFAESHRRIGEVILLHREVLALVPLPRARAISVKVAGCCAAPRELEEVTRSWPTSTPL